MWFNSLKIRERILAGYSVPLLFAIGVAGIVYLEIEKFQEKNRTEVIVEQVVENANDIAWSIVGIGRATRGYMLDRDIVTINQFERGVELFDTSVKNLQTIELEDLEQKQRLEKILQLSRNLIQFNRDLIELTKNGNTTKALEEYSSFNNQELNRELEEVIEDFQTAEFLNQQARREASQQSVAFLKVVVSIGTLISVILSIFIGWILTQRITDTLNDTANTIASSSTEIATTVEQQESLISQQATSVNQTTATMDELDASSRQAAENSESSRVQIEQISQQIVYLIEQVNQINQIANLVSEIANQTNMLALNAAVEAARAGTSGKGFAVVASEIRKLADQSKQSADKINGVVLDIQKATNSAIVVNTAQNRNVDSLLAAVNNIALNAQQISLSSQQQAEAVTQVFTVMNNLNQSAQEIVSGISQTKVGIQQLNEMAIRLREEV
jgi:methyl-accepting chemotaxis protein